MEEFQCIKILFPNFKIMHIPSAQHTMEDKFASGARSSYSAILCVEYESPVYLSELIG